MHKLEQLMVSLQLKEKDMQA